MGRMTATVHDSAQAPVYARLQEGSDAPDFTLPAIVPGTAENGLINLSDVLEDGRRVVLYFYPAAMTPGCTTEACDFRDNLARLESQNVAVLGVSKDSLEKLRKFAEHDHLTFPLLSDPDLTVHKLYGAYGEKKLYGKIHVGVIRSTLVINPDGSVHSSSARYVPYEPLPYEPPVDLSDSPANSETVGAQYVYGWHVIERCCGGIEHQFADGGGC